MTLNVVEGLEPARRALADLRARGGRVAFVPTMGALHDGHLSLCRRGRERADAVVASIFVNPLQFGPGEDLESYPRDLAGDAAKLESAGVDLLFTMQAAEMYPPEFSTHVEVGGSLIDGLCAGSRPGHFRGVTTVVAKLFGIVRPDLALFGQKDLQQALVLRRMTTDLDLGVELVICPTIREPDGLAMSSRNAYLSVTERESALKLIRGLRAAISSYESGERNAMALADLVRGDSSAHPEIEWDYVEVRRLPDLSRFESGAVTSPLAVLCAARLGRARLIDNLVHPDDALA